LGEKSSEFSSLLLPEQKGFETGLNVNIAYGNLKSEYSQDYAQNPQRNDTFMNSASGETIMYTTYIVSKRAMRGYQIIRMGFEQSNNQLTRWKWGEGVLVNLLMFDRGMNCKFKYDLTYTSL